MGVKAVHFDGKTFLEHDPFLSIPSSSRYGLLSFWYKGDGGLVIEALDDFGNFSLTANAGGGFNIELVDGPDFNKFGLAGVIIPNDSSWHHVLCSWDTGVGIPGGFNPVVYASKCDIYIDNSLVNTLLSLNSFAAAEPGFEVDYSSSYKWSVGARDGRRLA